MENQKRWVSLLTSVISSPYIPAVLKDDIIRVDCMEEKEKEGEEEEEEEEEEEKEKEEEEEEEEKKKTNVLVSDARGHGSPAE